MPKKQLLKKTAVVSINTILSRILGIIRETLTIRYLGATMLADAFVTAFKIPNTLRKAFAEGALSAAIVPVLTSQVHEQGKQSVSGLMCLFFLLFESLVFALCIIAIIFSEYIIGLVAPGFQPEMIIHTAQMLRILMPFIASVSMSALFAGALQADNRFFIPSVGPVILNIVIIGTLLLCLGWQLPVSVLCIGIVCGGFLQCVIHYYAYLRAGFSFSWFKETDLNTAGTVLLRFLLCLPSISLMELSSFIDTSFASYLKPGSISLLYLSNRFVGIPLGVFAVAFATVLLPHMSRVARISRKRLSFYLLEGAKLVWWVCLPAMLMIGFFARPLFETLFVSSGKFTLDQVTEAATILCAFLGGLFFFSFNKVLLNAYYALHITGLPAAITACATAANVLLDWLLIDYLQATGLALATSASAGIQTILLLTMFHWKYKHTVYLKPCLLFMGTYAIQVALFFIPFWITYTALEQGIVTYTDGTLQWLLLHSLCYWLWVGPLGCCYMAALWYCRSWMDQKIYFLQ